MQINSLQTTTLFLKEQLFTTLTTQQKRILVVSSIALICIAAFCLFYKCCFQVSQQNSNDLDDSGQKTDALKGKINPQGESVIDPKGVTGLKPIQVVFPQPDQSTTIFGKNFRKSYIFNVTPQTTVGDLRKQYIEMVSQEYGGKEGTTPKLSDIRIVFCGVALKDDMSASKLMREGMFHIVVRKTNEAIEKKTAHFFFAERRNLPAMYHDCKESQHLFDLLTQSTLSMYDRLVRGKLEGHEKNELETLQNALTFIKAKTSDVEIQHAIDGICETIDYARDRFDTIVKIHQGKLYKNLLKTIEEVLKTEKELMSRADHIAGDSETVRVAFTFENIDSLEYKVNKALLRHFVPPLNDLLEADSIVDHSRGIEIPIRSLKIIIPLLDYINRIPVNFSKIAGTQLISLAYTAHEYHIPGLESRAVQEIMDRATKRNNGEILALFQGEAKLPGLLGQLKETALFKL